MILNEIQKKEVIKLVTERVTQCKEKGRDPMFIAGEIEDCIVWNLYWKFEWYDFKNDKDLFLEYGYSVSEDIIKKVYGSSRIEYHLNKITNGRGDLFKEVIE